MKDPFELEMSAQREHAEAADEQLVSEAQRWRERRRELARHARPALEQRLTRMAKTAYARRLTAIALEQTPDDIIVRIDRRRMEREKCNGIAVAARRFIVLDHPPTTLLALRNWLHEVSHILLNHVGGKEVKMPNGSGTWHPGHEVEADTRAQKIMQSHGLKIPREGRDYLRAAIHASV